jgi:hypothetical protein
MTTMQPPPGNGPFRSREQTEAVFAGFREGAERGTFGPPGEQIVGTYSQALVAALTDTVEGFGGELGDYDRQLIERLAGLLDPVDVRVLCSWTERVHDTPDDSPRI